MFWFSGGSKHGATVVWQSGQSVLIDFSEVMETNETTLRKDNFGTSTFVKWIGETPPSVQNLVDTYNYPIYTLDEIIEILRTDAWVSDVSE